MAENWLTSMWCRESVDGRHKPIVMVRRDEDELTERVECDECGLPLPITVKEFVK